MCGRSGVGRRESCECTVLPSLCDLSYSYRPPRRYQPSIRAETAQAKVTPAFRSDNSGMQLRHDDILHADVAEALSWIGSPAHLILCEEVDAIGIYFV